MKTDPTYYTDLIARYFNGEASPVEIRELEEWTGANAENAALFSSYSKTWRTLQNDRIAGSLDVSAEWESLQNKLGKTGHDIHPQEAAGRSLILTWMIRVAAVVIILAIPTFFLVRYLSSPVEKQVVASAGTLEVTLSDGTAVTLNQGAVLTYPSGFEGNSRSVTLEGEAWFEVAHDKAKPFIISSGDARIRVLGTSFFVDTRTWRETREVVLATGMVKVWYAGDPEKTAFLRPGQKAEMGLTEHSIVVESNRDPNFLAWKTGRLVFENTPLNEVAALMTQVFHTGVRLSGNDLANCRITATFDHQSLEQVLNVLRATLEIQVRNSGAGIEISGHGCISKQ